MPMYFEPMRSVKWWSPEVSLSGRGAAQNVAGATRDPTTMLDSAGQANVRTLRVGLLPDNHGLPAQLLRWILPLVSYSLS